MPPVDPGCRSNQGHPAVCKRFPLAKPASLKTLASNVAGRQIFPGLIEARYNPGMIDYSWLILLNKLPATEAEKHPTLAAQLAPGDELWEFDCSESREHPLGGCSGVALRRGDQIVAHVVTRQRFTY